MFFYTAYKLGIHSQIPLRDLVAVANAPEDVTIQLRRIDGFEQTTTRNGTYFLGETPGVAMFLVRDGKEIIVDACPGVDESLISTILLGPGMAVLLRQRGFAVLHASGIAINGHAIAFLGQSGWGKSTLAEAFYDRGYGVVTDDVMAVRLDGKCPQVVSGYPSIKLFPETAVFLGCDVTATHRVHSQTEKRAHPVTSTFPQGPLPLQRIYALAGGECNAIEPLEPREVFLELVRNARAVNLVRDAGWLAEHLRQCTRLATQVPVFRLRRQRALSALPGLVDLIEEHLAQKELPTPQ